MARKVRRLTHKKRRSSRPVKTEAAGNIQYEVEKVIGTSNKGNTIYFEVKWKGFPSEENTQEPEFRLTCDDKILSYLVRRLDPIAYLDTIPESIEDIKSMKTNKNYILDVIEPLTSIGQMTVLNGSVKFVNVDSIPSRVRYLKHMITCEQSYILKSLFVPSEDDVRRDMKQYQEELDLLQKSFTDYPKITIRIPYQIQTVFYSPPPLSKLLFEPISEAIFEERESDKYHFPPNSDILGFNKVAPFIDRSHLEEISDKKIKPTLEKDRLDFNSNPRFNVRMSLSQYPACGWNLTLNEEVDENTPLLVIAGIVRPVAVAQKCLEEEGEIVAFSSFIEIPNSGMCLDRREFFDFSKYIPHNCEPTCGVRLVNSGNDVPDLVVYSLVSIDSSCTYTVSLDYFQMFQSDVKDHFLKNPAPDGQIFSLYEKLTDFVHCQCSMPSCKEVLYVSTMQKQSQKLLKSSKKKSRLDSEEESEQKIFGGLNLVDSDRIYAIRNGEFVD
ncbi:hypothetical protein L5515_001404 [Caenorhabditis briggsae]|uniref:Chromo domain-containing protein n=1 Tax=Caenorhabditis briggsae TaxID=6238 RepID=A0AAE9E2X5_CAEBR|nr:hypothetical protein L5515_001404 [Caenorhabditis briggsae]